MHQHKTGLGSERSARKSKAYFHDEPRLDDLMDDSVMRALLTSDGLSREDVEDLMADVRARLE